MSSIFLVPTKNIFKNYNTWLWSGLAFFRSRLSAPAFVELRSKEDNPLNKLVKQKNRTVNYRNKCDFLYFAKRIISSSIHSVTIVTSAKQHRYLVLGTQRTQRITGSAFRISFHPDWQIDNGLFNRPIMTRTKSWYTGGGSKQGFR